MNSATDINFRKVNGANSHIGFVSFKYAGLGFTDIGVHKLLNPKEYIRIRLVYPKSVAPSDRGTQEEIDREINDYLLAHELLKGN